MGVPAFPLGPFTIPAFTFFLDLGSYFIVIGQIRAFFIVAKIHQRTLFIILRRLWGFFVFVMLVAGLYMACFKLRPDLKLEPSSPEALSLIKVLHTVGDVGYAVAGTARTVLLVTMIAMVPYMVMVATRTRRTRPDDFDYARWVQALAFCVTFLLVLPILVPSLLRTWMGLSLSLPVYVVTAIIPELLIAALWLALARFITRQDTQLAKLRTEVRVCLKRVWLGFLSDKGTDTIHSIMRRAESPYRDVVTHATVGLVGEGTEGVLGVAWKYARATPSQRKSAALKKPRLLAEIEALTRHLRVQAGDRGTSEKEAPANGLPETLAEFRSSVSLPFIGNVLRREAPATDAGLPAPVDPGSGMTAQQALRYYVSTESPDFSREEEYSENYDGERLSSTWAFMREMFRALAHSIVLEERRQDSVFQASPLWQINTAATRTEYVLNLMQATFNPNASDAEDLADIWMEILLWERGVF